MKFHLVKGSVINLGRRPCEIVASQQMCSNWIHYKTVELPASVIPADDSSQELEKCATVKEMLNKHSAIRNNSTKRRRGDGHVKMPDPTWNGIALSIGISGVSNQTGTHVRGYVRLTNCLPFHTWLDNMRNLWGKHAKLEVELETPTNIGCPLKIKSSEMEISRFMEIFPNTERRHSLSCVDNNMWYPARHFHNFNPDGIQLSVTISVYIPSESIQRNCFQPGPRDIVSLNKRILQDETLSDVTIIAENGVRIKAHKVFLAAQSPVLRAMLQNDMDESGQKILELLDMSEETVRVLLKFLYYNELKSVYGNCILVLSLFAAAHKYNIDALKNVLGEFVLKQPDEWFRAEGAIKLFVLARNKDPADEELKWKAVQLLKRFAASLGKSKAYHDLFKEDLNGAMELCKYALMA